MGKLQIWGKNGTVLIREIAIIESPAEKMRQQLVTDLKALPIGVQIALERPATAIREALVAGDVARAKAIVETYPLGGDATLEAVRAKMLERFNSVNT